MPTSFAITTTSGQVHLDRTRRAQVSYIVTNRRGQECRGRVRPVPLEGAQDDWLQVSGDRERTFAVEETHHFRVEVSVPPDAPSGSYAIRLDAVAEDNPDEDYTQGPTVALMVAEGTAPQPPARTGYLRTLAGTAIGALAGVAAGAFLGILIGLALSTVSDDVAFPVAIAILLVVPWLGAVLGSWQSLRMGSYGRARATGLVMAGIFPFWEALIIGFFVLISDSNRIPGVLLFVLIVLVIAPSWVIVPALTSRFVALRTGTAEPGSAGDRNQSVAT